MEIFDKGLFKISLQSDNQVLKLNQEFYTSNEDIIFSKEFICP
jgi:hypothetical protein